jgi:hypothetical protein
MRSALKAGIVSTVMALSLAGCQPPVVPVRSYTFNATFVADGRQYVFSMPYQCHYEDLTWVSERGADWHVRKGMDALRIVGHLADGTAFEVLPSASTPDVFCSEHGGAVQSQLFIATSDGGAISVTPGTDAMTPHKARLSQTSLTLVSEDSARFLDHSKWPAPTKLGQHFYTVQARYYDASLWKQDPAIVTMVDNRTVRWLEDREAWPFDAWTDKDVAFARVRQRNRQLDEYADAGERFPLALVGDAWQFAGPDKDMTVWRPAPEQPDVKHWAEPGMTRWIDYDGHRIELSVHAYNRVFYEHKSDRLVEFRAVHVGLW